MDQYKHVSNSFSFFIFDSFFIFCINSFSSYGAGVAMAVTVTVGSHANEETSKIAGATFSQFDQVISQQVIHTRLIVKFNLLQTTLPMLPPALCDSRRSSSYRRHTPSKQHLLCDGRSAAEVVLRHRDFRKARRRVKKKVRLCRKLREQNK